LVHLDYSNVAADLAALTGPSLVEARLWGNDAFNARVLMGLGFHKICLQSVLAVELAPECVPERVVDALCSCPLPLIAVDLETTLLDRHARNFHCNSLEFDTRITETVWSAFNRMRLEQSLTSPDVLKFLADDGLVSFKPEDDKVVIDLLSVLTQRKGTGAALMRRVFDWSLANGVSRVEVTTECENILAMLFYQQCGFRLTGNIAVFHRHADDPRPTARSATGRGKLMPRPDSSGAYEAVACEGRLATRGR